MRIVTSSIIDFLTNLSKAEKIVGKVVWYDKTENPVCMDSRREAPVVQVNLQATAVMEFAGGEALLQYGEDCGKDYRDASQEFEGTEKADRLIKQLVRHCSEAGLDARPGIIHM